MKNGFFRSVAFLMALVLALSALSLFHVGAEEEAKYFIFDTLLDENDTEHSVVGAQLTLPLGDASAFTVEQPEMLSSQSNAFYISLQNNSNASKIRVAYTYKVQGGTEIEIVEGEISRDAAVQKLTLPAAHLDAQIEEIVITFHADEAVSGSAVLYAFFDISTYIGNDQSEITLSRCHYNEEENALEIQGSLSYAATVRYEGETLALFALSEGEDIHLSGKTPLARTDVSFNFSFQIPISRNDELFQRYVVAAITSAGERVPLCTPTYPSMPLAASAKVPGFKGYHSQDFSRVMDNIPDTGVVDVYLDRLFGTQHGGVLYEGEYEYYYFDQAYVEEIEHRVKNLDGQGTSVYLRLLIGNSRDTLSFADDAPAGVTNRLAVLRNETAQRELYAMIDFLASRFQGSDAVRGVILGRSADLVSQYSYCDSVTLAQYTSFYAATLNLISGAARRHLPALRVIVPVSDRVWEGSASSLQESKDFYTALFLPSLLAALEAQILEPQAFGLMLENSTLSERVGGSDPSHIGIDRLETFLNDLARSAAQYSCLDTHILFSWAPDTATDAATLHADYLLKYTVLLQNERVYTFLLDFSAAEERDLPSGAQSIDYLARYINTDRVTDAAQLALSTLGVQSLTQLYANAAQMNKRQVLRTELTTDGYQSAAQIKGSFALWRFSSADDTLGWYEGTAARTFTISSANQTAHTLVAHFEETDGYGEIAYHFDEPVDLSFAPLWNMPISVTGKAGTRYEVQLRLIADSAVTYASAVLEEGQSGQLYLDLSANPSVLRNLRAIRVMARPLDGTSEEFALHFGGMTVQSAELEDKELSERVSAIWQNRAGEGDAEPARDYAVPLMISGSVALISVGVCAVLIILYRRKKKQKVV